MPDVANMAKHPAKADQREFALDAATWDAFTKLLDEPPRPDPRLVELFARRQRITRSRAIVRVARYDDVSPSKEQPATFSCAERSLDRWLATQAHQRMHSSDAVTYLLLDDRPIGSSR